MSRKSTQKAMALAKSARIVGERSLAEAQAVFLKLERNRLMAVVATDVDAKLDQGLSEKETLLIELAEWKERS